jgi:hypothetical protein
MAMLLHPGSVEPLPLYLGCAIRDLPVTVVEDSLRSGVQLLSHIGDLGLRDRAKDLLSNGGLICREMAREWFSAFAVNSFNSDSVEESVRRLVSLGWEDPLRPFGSTDFHSLDLDNYPWSEDGNERLLLGDLHALEPEQFLVRMEALTNPMLLVSLCRRVGGLWKKDPDFVKRMWESLHERNDWPVREAAAVLAEFTDPSFLHGPLGEQRRRYLEAMRQDPIDSVAEAACRACIQLGIPGQILEAPDRGL